MSDYIPSTEAAFDSWQTNLVSEVETNSKKWGIPDEEVAELKSSQAPWTIGYAKVENKQMRTSVDVAVKNKASADYHKYIRRFVMQWLSVNPKVTDADRTRLDITIHTGVRTVIPAPSTAPVGQIDFSIRHQHTLSYYDQESAHSNAKPEGVTGCEIYVKVDGEAPVSVDEMKYLGTCSASPYVVKYDAGKAGKIAYYWLRWVNHKGEVGPWSIVVSGMILG